MIQGNGKLLNQVNVRKLYIDMNGDGRMDFVDAQTDLTKWIVHLNTPDPTDPNKSLDIVRTISTAPMRAAINRLSQSHGFIRVVEANPFPLARISSVEDTTLDACWMWGLTPPVWFPSDGCPGFSDAGRVKPEKTITEWELKDINGDGYPDFIYNEAHINIGSTIPPTSPGTVLGQKTLTRTPVDSYLSKNVMAMINTIGVHMTNGDDVAFASPILLANDGCGVARWQAVPGAASARALSQTVTL